MGIEFLERLLARLVAPLFVEPPLRFQRGNAF